jgi:nucleotide-binding universal stress UspA family protein
MDELLSKEDIMKPIQRILHPTDFSAESGKAFEIAVSLGRAYQAAVTILHAVPPPIVLNAETAAVEEGKSTQGLKAWEALRQREASDVVLIHELMVIDDDPAKAILRRARDLGAELIVMATHGRSGLSRMMHGSSAEEVLRRAPCPVVTVNPQCQTLNEIPTTATAKPATPSPEPVASTR